VNVLSPEELVIFISTLSIAIAKDKTAEELSAVFTQIGDTLATIIAQREILENDNNKVNNNDDNNDSKYN